MISPKMGFIDNGEMIIFTDPDKLFKLTYKMQLKNPTRLDAQFF